MTQTSLLDVDLRNRTSFCSTKILVATVFILFLLHWCGFYSARLFGEDYFVSRQLIKLFWLDREYNIPSWFSSCILWSCGAALLIIAAIHQSKKGQFSRHWFLLGMAFLLISMDEAVAIHEWMIIPIRESLGVSGIFYFAWIIPALVLIVIGGLAYIPFLRYLPKNLRRLFLVSAVFFISGAIGMEMLGGAASSGEIGIWVYQIVMPIEELLEMFGVVLFLHGLIAVIVSKQKTRTETV